MALNKTDRPDGTKMRGPGRMCRRERVCVFYGDKNGIINYKDVNELKRYVSERGRILSHRTIDNYARHQRTLTIATRRARHIAPIPYAYD